MENIIFWVLFLRKLNFVKIYLDFYYTRWKTSKPGHKEHFLQGSPLKERSKKIQIELNISYMSVFLIQRAWALCEEDAGGAYTETSQGSVQSPRQEQGIQAHRGSPSLGHQEVPQGWGQAKARSAYKWGSGSMRWTRLRNCLGMSGKKRSRMCDCWDCPGVKTGTAVHLKGESSMVYS